MLIKLLLRFAAAVAAAVGASAKALLQCSALFGIHIWSLTNCWRPVAEVITFFLSYFLGLVSCRLQNETRAQCAGQKTVKVFFTFLNWGVNGNVTLPDPRCVAYTHCVPHFNLTLSGFCPCAHTRCRVTIINPQQRRSSWPNLFARNVSTELTT